MAQRLSGDGETARTVTTRPPARESCGQTANEEQVGGVEPEAVVGCTQSESEDCGCWRGGELEVVEHRNARKQMAVEWVLCVPATQTSQVGRK